MGENGGAGFDEKESAISHLEKEFGVLDPVCDLACGAPTSWNVRWTPQ